MSKEIDVEGEDGVMIKETVYTQAELDDIRAKDKEHIDQKLEEFKRGKTASELATEENRIAMEKIAADAKAATELAQSTITKARGKVVDFISEQIVGQDPELRKKLNEEMATLEIAYKAQNKDITDDKIIQEMLVKAAGMAGINVNATPQFPMVGGMGPSFQPRENEVSDAEHNTFLEAVGYPKDKPAKKE